MSEELDKILRLVGQGGARPMMPPAIKDRSVDPSMFRPDGSRKGMGFLGQMPFHDGRTSTELSIGVNLGGKQTEIPSLVPTLHPDEIQHLLRGGEMTPSIVQKAVEHARMRMQQGRPVFADDQDKPAMPSPAGAFQ